MNADQLPDWLKQQAEDIVKSGRNVREEIAKVSSSVAGKFHQTKNGFADISRSVLDGAVAGAQQAFPGQSESVLREVVAGLAEGLAISANAVRLTLEESRGRGAQFAHEDLKKVAEDFREAGEHFKQAVHEATDKLGAQISAQSLSLADHAGHTLGSVRPAIDAAIKAACDDPSALGKETLQAGASATRQAAGVLFSELGKRLERAGDQLLKRSD
jgi:hypothetical protein